MSPRKSNADPKHITHERILDSANHLLKTEGVSGASVEKVMGGAGLTIGGFYAHFKSKDYLIAEAIHHAFARRREKRDGVIGRLTGHKWLEKYVHRYLSSAHRDHPEEGCPVPAVLSEITRAGDVVHNALGIEIERWAEDIMANLPGENRENARKKALAIISTLAGAMSLSRALGENDISDEVLKAAQEYILDKEK